MKRIRLFLLFALLGVPALAQDNLELPGIKKSDIVIRHSGYTLSYNPDAMLPFWVAYALHPGDMEGDAQRETGFSPDPSPLLRKYRLAEHWHYTRSGWVRGHMAPAGDMKYSQQAMTESFYTTNVCPMDMSFNNGIWKRLEEKVRKLALQFGVVYIITGPVMGDNINGKVGESGISVPDAFFKAVLVPHKGSYLSIGFYMKNEAAPKGSKLKDYALTVDELESMTGMDFFVRMNAVEAFSVEKQLPLKELGLY